MSFFGNFSPFRRCSTPSCRKFALDYCVDHHSPFCYSCKSSHSSCAQVLTSLLDSSYQKFQRLEKIIQKLEGKLGGDPTFENWKEIFEKIKERIEAKVRSAGGASLGDESKYYIYQQVTKIRENLKPKLNAIGKYLTRDEHMFIWSGITLDLPDINNSFGSGIFSGGQTPFPPRPSVDPNQFRFPPRSARNHRRQRPAEESENQDERVKTLMAVVVFLIILLVIVLGAFWMHLNSLNFFDKKSTIFDENPEITKENRTYRIFGYDQCWDVVKLNQISKLNPGFEVTHSSDTGGNIECMFTKEFEKEKMTHIKCPTGMREFGQEEKTLNTFQVYIFMVPPQAAESSWTYWLYYIGWGIFIMRILLKVHDWNEDRKRNKLFEDIYQKSKKLKRVMSNLEGRYLSSQQQEAMKKCQEALKEVKDNYRMDPLYRKYVDKAEKKIN